jgi:dTDP-4-dehydrorhamnose reductase
LRILITGASGLFGSKLAETAYKKNHQVYSGYNKNLPPYGKPVPLDISNKNHVKKAFEKINPEVIVHSAALTDVDRCEVEKDLAWRTNVLATQNIVETARKNQNHLVYVSTDYVFNGQKGMYTEDDQTEAINHYGLTKIEAERLVKSLPSGFCIVRGSVIYGSRHAPGKPSFALWILERLKRREPVKTVVDQWTSPTLNSNMAETTLEIIERKLQGIFHVAGATRISRYDFAIHLAKTFNLDTQMLTPVTSTEFTWTAKRPRDSSLSTAKAQRTLKNKPIELNTAIEKLKKELQQMHRESSREHKRHNY